MKFLILTTLLLSQSLFAGDLGGGGSMGFRVSNELVDNVTLRELKKSQSLEEAYHKWLHKMTEEQRRKVFEQSFEDYVIPKLSKDSI